jgi:hypothetical protein
MGADRLVARPVGESRSNAREKRIGSENPRLIKFDNASLHAFKGHAVNEGQG